MRANPTDINEDGANCLSFFLVLEYADKNASFLAKIDLGIARTTGDVQVISSFERTEKQLKKKPGVGVSDFISHDALFDSSCGWLSDDSITLVCDVCNRSIVLDKIYDI